MKVRVLMVVGMAGMAVAASGALAASPSKYDRPERSSRVSLSSNGAQAHVPAGHSCVGDDEGSSAMSADGRYVAFQSDADNLITNGAAASSVCQIYVRDQRTGVTTIASVSSTGVPGIGEGKSGQTMGGSTQPSISADGRYVAFSSDVPNLVPGDTNATTDIFVHDMKAHWTKRVSVASNGAQSSSPLPGLPNSTWPTISADGQVIAFTSLATNIGGPTPSSSTCGCPDGSEFVHDMRTGKTTLVSIATDGTRVRGINGSISGNGRYVVFTSAAKNLVPGGTNDGYNVFRRDLRLNKTELVSTASDGSLAAGSAVGCAVTPVPDITLPAPLGGSLPQSVGCGWSQTSVLHGTKVSSDGRFVTFWSSATNFVPNSTCDDYKNTFEPSVCPKVYVKDMVTGRVERIDVDSYGHPRSTQQINFRPGSVISGDGRFVGYQFTDTPSTCAPNVGGVQSPVTLPVGVTCNRIEGYIYDRLSGTMDWITQALSGGQGTPGRCRPDDVTDSYKSKPSGLSYDGRYVAFDSSLTNVVPGDTNKLCDSFVRDRGRTLGMGDTGTASPSTSPDPTCPTDPICLPSTTAAGSVITSTALLTSARLVPRPALHDLWVRWDLSRLSTVAGGPSGGLLYELQFAHGGQRYAVRAQRVAGPDFDAAGGASFGLFRQTKAGLWTHAAALKGGYGTIGDAVVTAVPLNLLSGKAQLTDVTAYTAVGSYLSGPTKVLDSLRLSR